MSAPFPEFADRMPIDATLSWTAAFESYDQHNDDCYYIVCVYELERLSARFMVRVAIWWAGADWRLPEFADRLRRELYEIAKTGKSNTDYRGALGRRDAAGVEGPCDL